MERIKSYLTCNTRKGLVVLSLYSIPDLYANNHYLNALMDKPIVDFETAFDPDVFDTLREMIGRECEFRVLIKSASSKQTTAAKFDGIIRSLCLDRSAYHAEDHGKISIYQICGIEISQERNDLMEITFKKFDSPMLRPVYGNLFSDCISGGEEKMKRELAEAKKNTIPRVKKILKNGDYMTVLWADGTKTIVKRAADEPASDYAAFTAAVAIRAYGPNSALKRIIEQKAEIQKKRKKK